MLDLSQWPYVQAIALAGDLESDGTAFLTANGKEKTARHCIAVAEMCVKIAARLGMDEKAAYAAALLHDISNVVKPQDMLRYAVDRNWTIDAAERAYPFLLHQRLSSVFARELFRVQDSLILAAIGCHTTLKDSPSACDMILFLADKLSWDQEGTPPFYDAVSSALDQSLARACLVYIRFVLDHGMILHPHQWLRDAKEWLEKQT